MKNSITGIHHVTAISSRPQENLDFYTKLLGLRLVKKTVNFDDPTAYHLYFGDEVGSPGSIVTFFYWPGDIRPGRVGAGQSTRLSFSVPMGSLDFWKNRLTESRVEVEMVERFGERTLSFFDPDRIPVEIVEVNEDSRIGWQGAGIGRSYAIRGFHTVELSVNEGAAAETLLTDEMGFGLVRSEGSRTRYAALVNERSGHFVDVIEDKQIPRGLGGSGTIHHVAWSTPNGDSQTGYREALQKAGYTVSPVMDRTYFESIYFRVESGILFEIATAKPGFAVDESQNTLGQALKLPPQFEGQRAAIERDLIPLDTH